MYNFGRLDFPNQHVSYAEKQNVDWYAKCCDYVIEAGIACKADFNVCLLYTSPSPRDA